MDSCWRVGSGVLLEAKKSSWNLATVSTMIVPFLIAGKTQEMLKSRQSGLSRRLPFDGRKVMEVTRPGSGRRH